MLFIRSANENDIEEIERMVADFVKGHPAEFSPAFIEGAARRLLQ
jgi:hypothetical protein